MSQPDQRAIQMLSANERKKRAARTPPSSYQMSYSEGLAERLVTIAAILAYGGDGGLQPVDAGSAPSLGGRIDPLLEHREGLLALHNFSHCTRMAAVEFHQRLTQLGGILLCDHLRSGETSSGDGRDR